MGRGHSTHTQTDRQTDIATTRPTRPRGPSWWKLTPWTPRSSIFSSFFVNSSAKFGFLNVQIRNNFKNIIITAFKWCKICNFYVNSIVILDSTCQKKEQECIWAKYLIYAILLLFFPPHLCSQHFRFEGKKNLVFNSGGGRVQSEEYIVKSTGCRVAVCFQLSSCQAVDFLQS